MMRDAIITVMFYLIAISSLIAAVAMVNTRRLLRAAVYLMLVLVLSAGFYILLDATFLGGVQVLVYVGGIVVVIVFAIMLTSSTDLLEDNPPTKRKIIGAFTSISFMLVSIATFVMTDFPLLRGGMAPTNGAQAIGQKLLDYGPRGYVLPFEIISLLLLVAIIGGIVIARRHPAPGQPMTTGGDAPGEVNFVQPKRQSDPLPGDKEKEGRS